MGKSQKQKALRRHNPVRVPDTHLAPGLSSASATSSKTEAVLPIIQKLEGADVADRTWACAAVSNLIQNDPSTRRLLQGKNVVGALISRLSDNVEEVVVEAAGALRNLCIDGGYDICAEMYNKNILTPLKTFIPKISNLLGQFINNPSAAPSNTHVLVCDFAENIITILWCLSETSNKALTAINNMGLVPFLVGFLDARSKLPAHTVTAAAQCLYVLSDENGVAIEELRSDSSFVTCLTKIAEPAEAGETGQDDRVTTLRVLTCGILRNIAPLPSMIPATSASLEQTVILPFLVPLLSVSLQDYSQRVRNVSSDLEPPAIEKLSLKHAPKSDHKSPAQLELDGIEIKLRIVQLSLEILTGICAQLPDPEPASAADLEDDRDDEVDEDMMDEELAPPVSAPANGQPSLEFESHMGSLLTPLLALLHPTPLSFAPSGALSEHPPTTSVLGAIHVAALECLNNLFLSLEDGNGDVQQLSPVWNELWNVLGEVGLVNGVGPGPEKKREVWAVGVGVLWGIARVCKGQLVPDGTQVKLLMDLCDATNDERTKVKCIGTLECLAQHRESIEANQVIANFLLKFITASQVEPMVQAVSALIDIYSDEDAPYDVNFRQGGFVATLDGARGHVKRTVKSIDKRKDGGMELWRRADEINDNLAAFVKYRKAIKL